MPGDGGGEVGRASHGLEACDFRHAGLRLEWGHEHSPDAFEVFALAVSRDGTKIAAGGACPSAPGVAHVRVWRLGDDDDDHTHAHAHPSARSHASRAAAASTRATLEAVLRAEGAVGCLSVALYPTGDAAFAGMADGSMWAWDLPSGALRYGGSDAETHPALAKLPGDADATAIHSSPPSLSPPAPTLDPCGDSSPSRHRAPPQPPPATP